MPENSQLLIHEDEGSIHLKLVGEFDANSAIDVLNLVNKRSPMISRVFIHTNCLNKIHPEARKLLQDSMDSMDNQSIPVFFTGEKAISLVTRPSIPWCHQLSYELIPSSPFIILSFII